jgi:N-acyl-D-aspartate/D-glutamate deacylase
VVRHGTTTVLVGNCSLGTAFGSQKQGEQDPIVDCFTRVENMPKSVLRKSVAALAKTAHGEGRG